MSDNAIYDGSDDTDDNADSDNKRPILTNDDQGAAAWLHTDKNGNAYISVKLPLGLGSLNLFPGNDTVEDALNQLADYLDDQTDD